MKTIQLHKHKVQTIERRHPWIFSGALAGDTSGISNGEIVTITDHKSRFLARGHFQHATIAVRVLTFDDVPVDKAFFQAKLKNAIELRIQLNLIREDSNICRLVHGEGDSLPGLVVDYYNGVAVIQCHSIGMYHSIKWITEGLHRPEP